MPNKLTDKEIVKALECCPDAYKCDDCECRGYCSKDFEDIMKYALDLINRLQGENERLNKLAELGNMRANDYRVMRDRALKAEKEVERLGNAYKQCAWERDIFAEDMKEEIKKDCSYLMLDIKTIKEQAYKECIEKVEEIICDNTYPDFDINHKAVNIWKPEAYKNINNLLKELVGDSQ